MPAANLVRMALRKLEGVMTRPPLQRHIALQVATAYLDGAIACSQAEATRVRVYPTPRDADDLRCQQEETAEEQADASSCNRIAWGLQFQVALLMYGIDDEHQEQWASVHPDQLRLEAVL